MSDPEPEPQTPSPAYRCPRCDSLVVQGAEKCIMCGLPRPEAVADLSTSPAETASSPAGSVSPREDPVEATGPSGLSGPASPFVESTVQERRSNLIFWATAAVVAVLLAIGWGALRENAPAVMAAFIPTTTPLPPTVTLTPTWTPIPTETLPPSATPTETPVPPPTVTLPPPRTHAVNPGETLFGLSLIYRVTAESIAQANGFGLDAPIQSGQTLVIPWPTPPPPLESIILEINGETVAADVTNCNIVTIQSGDSAYALSVANNVPLEAIIAVNHHTPESIQLLQPGDTLCVPRIVLADTLPPTPGPSPTPSLTPPPAGPALLTPVDGRLFEGDARIVLQWAAVKDLAEDEWYMVEMRDTAAQDALPMRGFTRDSSFRVPGEWRPAAEEPRLMEWVVSIVRVTGRRTDGGFIYTFGGGRSRPSTFLWAGTQPAATPGATLSPAPSPQP